MMDFELLIIGTNDATYIIVTISYSEVHAQHIDTQTNWLTKDKNSYLVYLKCKWTWQDL